MLQEDLELGAQFYESCATGVGDYFLDSILSDLDSLILLAGAHPSYFGFQRDAVEAISIRHLL